VDGTGDLQRDGDQNDQGHGVQYWLD